MPSPFPGMDPYLEQHLGDIAATAVVISSATLNRVLPNDLRSRMDERQFLEHPDDDFTTESFINILEARGKNEMFTRIEFLRPVETNGLKAYEASIGLARQNGLNIVEIDLFRTGRLSGNLPIGNCVRITRAGRETQTIKISFLERLPILEIPLRQTDRDAIL